MLSGAYIPFNIAKIIKDKQMIFLEHIHFVGTKNMALCTFQILFINISKLGLRVKLLYTKFAL